MSKRPKQTTKEQLPEDFCYGIPEDVAAIRSEIRKFFCIQDAQGNRIGSAKHGIYAFYDYDAEPIYVGQTYERLSGRVSRHLTYHRKHPDVRIARRASTIANLARVISERDVSPGLRRTLLTQAKRLERLATHRMTELSIATDFGSK